MTEPTAAKQDLIDAAMDLLVDLDRDDAGAAEAEAAKAWAAQSPSHAQAWQQANQIWDQMDAAAPELAALLDEEPMSRSAWRQPRAWAGIGGTALALLIAVFVLFPGTPEPRLLATGFGETASYTLADGSEVRLNARTTLRVDLSSTRRLIALETGEAFFDVATDASRPFRVTAGATQVEVLGTAFNLRHSGTVTRLMVTEGQVQISRQGAAAQLGAGQQVDSFAGGLSAVTPVDLATLAWRDGLFVFDQTPLSEVARALSAYYGVPVRLQGPGVSGQVLTGAFRRDRPDDIYAALETGLGLTVERSAESVILRQAPDG